MKSSPKKKQAPEPRVHQAPKGASAMPLGRTNYLTIGAGAAVIAASFWGMAIERQVDGFFALNIAPFLLIGAYAAVAVGILIRPRKH